MKSHMGNLKIALLTLILLFLGKKLLASECYHYHTKKSTELATIDGKLSITYITRDPNGISIANYSTKLLPNLIASNARIIGEQQDGTIIANDEAYYWIDNYSLNDSDIFVHKIMNAAPVSATFGARTFCINGVWQRLEYNQYEQTQKERVKFKTIPNFPAAARVLAHYSEGHGNYLLADSNKVYMYDEGEAELAIIPKLNGATAHFQLAGWLYGNHFLFDGNTFYLIGINYDDAQDITEQFQSLGLKRKFTDAKILMAGNENIYLDFGDGTLWAYISAGLGLADDSNVYFYPVEDALYLPKADIVMLDGKGYDQTWDLANQNDQISFPADIDPKAIIALAEGQYQVGNQVFEIQSGKHGRAFVATEKSQASATIADSFTFNNALRSYSHSLSAFQITPTALNYSDPNTHQQIKSIPHSSAVKDLKLAYAFDDKLLIEDVLIPSLADFKTIELLGSTVDVLQGCDGGRGQIQVVVEYNYFFKDKDRVYKYHSGKGGLEILPNKNAEDCTAANFAAMFIAADFRGD